MEVTTQPSFTHTFFVIEGMSPTVYTIIALFIFLILFVFYSRIIYDKKLTQGKDVFGDMFAMIVISALWQVMLLVLAIGALVGICLYFLLRTLNCVVLRLLNSISDFKWQK